MQTHKQGEKWVIAANICFIDANGVGGGMGRQASRIRESYDVWTGERWWGQFSAAMLFDTEESAQEYLEAHWEELQN